MSTQLSVKDLAALYESSNQRTFEVQLPITNVKCMFRCWNMAEQKKIADAKTFGGDGTISNESDKSDLIHNLCEVLQNCLTDSNGVEVKIKELPYIDWSWIFARISNESSEFNNEYVYNFHNTDENGKEVIDEVKFSYDIATDFTITNKEFNLEENKVITLNNFEFIMKFPTIFDIEELSRLPDGDKPSFLLLKSIDKIVVKKGELTMEFINDGTDENNHHISNLIMSLSTNHGKKLMKFTYDAPQPELRKTIVNPRTQEEKEIKIEIKDLSNFLEF